MNEPTTVVGYKPIVQTASVTGDELRLTLDSGATLTIPVRQVRSLAHLSDEQLQGVRAVTGGTILMWPKAGASIMVEALLEAVTGLQTLKSAQRKGGAARSHAKAQAARENGAKGGRPRKTPSP